MLIRVNRAPVMTLWAVVVAEHMGFDEEEAPTMGRVVAGLNAYAKVKALGSYVPHPKTVKEERKGGYPPAIPYGPRNPRWGGQGMGNGLKVLVFVRHFG